MSKGYTSDNFLSTVPYPLTLTKSKIALETTTAEQLETLFDLNQRLLIYPNIEELDEALCDILAKDYKVDWYIYDGTLDSKRSQLANCIYVHRHLGTKGALVAALKAVCPGAEVEEWFDYGGNPYYFRVVLDVTEQKTIISQDVVEKIVGAIKPTRAVMEDYMIIYCSKIPFVITVSFGYALYTLRMCGTYPNPAYQGVISDENIIVTPDVDATLYGMPMTATDYYSDTYPDSVTVVTSDTGDSNISLSSGSATYSATYCGTELGSL